MNVTNLIAIAAEAAPKKQRSMSAARSTGNM
jgi:hypothetical protein